MRIGIVTNLENIERGRYGAILADPPWKWDPYATSGKGRSAEAFYDVMPLEDIKKIPVASFARPDAVLFLWVHNSMLQDGLDIMNAWGFPYKSRGFTWLKTYHPPEEDLFEEGEISGQYVLGMGKWTRYQTELCLLGTRGNPKRLSGGVRELIISERREHSRKPNEIYERIEQLVPGPYLELFSSEANVHRKNWTRWLGKDRAPERQWASNSYPGKTGD
jgi:N6-adenosine-specific RNA methylase IME4